MTRENPAAAAPPAPPIRASRAPRRRIPGYTWPAGCSHPPPRAPPLPRAPRRALSPPALQGGIRSCTAGPSAVPALHTQPIPRARPSRWQIMGYAWPASPPPPQFCPAAMLPPLLAPTSSPYILIGPGAIFCAWFCGAGPRSWARCWWGRGRLRAWLDCDVGVASSLAPLFAWDVAHLGIKLLVCACVTDLIAHLAGRRRNLAGQLLADAPPRAAPPGAQLDTRMGQAKEGVRRSLDRKGGLFRRLFGWHRHLGR